MFLRSLLLTFAALALAISDRASAADPVPLRILCVGDSITQGVGGGAGQGGYRGTLRSLLVNEGFIVDFIGTSVVDSNAIPDPQHEGHSGWRIDEIASNINGWLAAIPNPDVILLHIGTNDFGQNNNTATAINRLDALITQITTQRPLARLIVTNLLEREEPRNAAIQSKFNPFVQGIVTAQANAGKLVSFFDMRPIVPLADMPDLLHPNQTGYNKMAAGWFTAIDAFFDPPPPVPTTIVQSTVSNSAASGTPGVDMTYTAEVSSADLLQGISGNYAGWQLTSSFSPANLNNGSHGSTSVGAMPNDLAFAADSGTSATYILGPGANGFGYDVSSLVSFASWRDGALFQQHYEIWIREIGNTGFRKLYTVKNELSPVADLSFGGSSRVTVTDTTGTVAHAIDAIRIVPLDIPAGFEPAPGGGSTTFREIDLFGTPATTPPATTITQLTLSNITAPSVAGNDTTYSADVSSIDLLHGITGTYVGWQLTGTFNPANLNNGTHGATSVGATPDALAFAADTGTSATYELGTGNFGLGYDVSTLVSIASWRDSGLYQQHYEIWVRDLGSANFRKLYTVANDLAPVADLNDGGSTKVTVSDYDGNLARGITAIRFVPLDIPSTFEPAPGGGSTTFREIDVFGASTQPPVVPDTITHSTFSSSAAANAAGSDMTYQSDVSSTDLLQGISGTYTGWQLTGTFNPANLNNGTHGATSVGQTPDDLAFAADSGTSATYILGPGANGRGFDITSIVSIASWRDSSLFQQHYEIWIRPLGGTSFDKLYTVTNDLSPIPSTNLAGSSKVTVADGSDNLVATGIDAIRFVILEIPSAFEPSPGGGSTTFREIDVFGTPTAATGSFATWAEDNDITNNPTGDTDGDGLLELVEYALGSNPNASTPQIAPAANGLLAFPKSALAVANGDVTYRIETSPALDVWTPVTSYAVNNNTSIEYLIPPGQGKLFARLVITRVP